MSIDRISIGNNGRCFIRLYRSPSQTQDEFQTFKTKVTSNLKLNSELLYCVNPCLTVMTGDSDAKSKHGWANNITSPEGSKLDFITSQPEIL